MAPLSKVNNGAVQDPKLRCVEHNTAYPFVEDIATQKIKSTGYGFPFPSWFLHARRRPAYRISTVHHLRHPDSYRLKQHYHDLHTRGPHMPTHHIPPSTHLYLALAQPLLLITYVALTNPKARMWFQRAADWVQGLPWTTGPSAKSDTQDVTDPEGDRPQSKRSTYSEAFDGLVQARKSSKGPTFEQVREASRVLREKLKEVETEFSTRDDELSRSTTTSEIIEVSRAIMEEVKKAEAKFGARRESTPREVPKVGPVEEGFYEYYDVDGSDRQKVEAWLAAVEVGDEVASEAGESFYSPNAWAEDLDRLD